MNDIGDIVFNAGDSEIRLRPLTVRQMISLQSVLAHRTAATVIADAKLAGAGYEKQLELATEARRNAMLTSSLIRWCFQTEGAVEIIEEAARAAKLPLDFIESISPDEFADIACQLVGFVWDATDSKWIGRSQRKSAIAIG